MIQLAVFYKKQFVYLDSVFLIQSIPSYSVITSLFLHSYGFFSLTVAVTIANVLLPNFILFCENLGSLLYCSTLLFFVHFSVWRKSSSKILYLLEIWLISRWFWLGLKVSAFFSILLNCREWLICSMLWSLVPPCFVICIFGFPLVFTYFRKIVRKDIQIFSTALFVPRTFNLVSCKICILFFCPSLFCLSLFILTISCSFLSLVSFFLLSLTLPFFSRTCVAVFLVVVFIASCYSCTNALRYFSTGCWCMDFDIGISCDLLFVTPQTPRSFKSSLQQK